jgi:hypothetical protein
VRDVPPPRRGAIELWLRGIGRMRGFGRPVGVAWLIHAALALTASLPMYEALDRALSHSRFAPAAERGFDFDWFGDFQAAGATAIAGLNTPLLLAAGLTLLLTVFLAGGVLGQLHARGRTPADGEPASAGAFLRDGARYYARFLRLFLMAAIPYALAFWFVRIGLSARLDESFDALPSSLAAFLARVAFTLVCLALFAWFHMAQDLARLAVVVEERTGMAFEYVRGLVRAIKHFGLLARMYLWALLGWLAVTAVFLLLAQLVGGWPGKWGTVAFLTLTQAYVLARVWIGFSLSASQVEWYEGNVR